MKGKNTMTVGAVNNNNQQNTYALQGMTAGLATGAVAGGTYGYLSKPWIKDGDVTDTFVRQFDENVVVQAKKNNDILVRDLKKMQETGSIEGISDVTRYTFEGTDLSKLSPEKIKAMPQTVMTEAGAKDLDDLLKILNRTNDAFSIKAYKQRAEIFKSVKDDTTVEALNKLIKDNKLEEAFGVVTETNRAETIEVMKSLDEDAAFVKAVRKFSILEHVDVKKKSLKKLSSDADFYDKSIYNTVKKTIRNTNLKAAAKWGAIGAGVLGAVGLGVGALNNKKS